MTRNKTRKMHGGRIGPPGAPFHYNPRDPRTRQEQFDAAEVWWWIHRQNKRRSMREVQRNLTRCRSRSPKGCKHSRNRSPRERSNTRRKSTRGTRRR